MSDEEMDFGDQNEGDGEEEEEQASPSVLEEGEAISQVSGPQTQAPAPDQDPGPGDPANPNAELQPGPGDPPDPVVEIQPEPGPSTVRSPRSSPSRKRKSSPPGTGEESKRKCNRKVVKSPSPKKNQGTDDGSDSDGDEGAYCNICMEPWTNSGAHRISSLRCGHFFGHACIERWLKGGGSNGSCPTCNEKANKRDVRVHYVARLKAIDTSEKDRAVSDLEKAKRGYRQLELEYNTLKVQLKMQTDQIDGLQRQLRGQHTSSSSLSNAAALADSPVVATANSNGNSFLIGDEQRLVYVRRLVLLNPESVQGERDKYCRLMTYNDTHMMLAVSQPSFTALAPGFGIRRINMLDQKVGSFVALHREPIRDLAFNPVRRDQLLSGGQDRCVKLTNVSSCAEIMKWSLDSEAWAVCWNDDDPAQFFVGTKRSKILLFDTREGGLDPTKELEFPVVERRPVIGLAYVKRDHRSAFPVGGLLVLTLGSLWFFENVGESAGGYKASKLPLDGAFWSMRFDANTRLVLVTTRPAPHSRQVALELSRVSVSDNGSDFVVTANPVLDCRRGGSYSERSFLRAAVVSNPERADRVLVCFGRGSTAQDHKLVVQEVGSDRVVQEVAVGRPVLDVCPIRINAQNFVAVLTGADVVIYKWS